MGDSGTATWAEALANLGAAEMPRLLWIELSSRCPFDCVFCSRRLRRGAGRNLDLDLYQQILSSLRRPACIRLNYSGESIFHPHLAEAIRMAKATGARVELVTVLAGADDAALCAAVEAGLDSLCLSLHTLQESRWDGIYRHESVSSFRRAFSGLIRARSASGTRLPALELAFVAMRRNLHDLGLVASFAERHEIPVVTVCPVIRRDPIPEAFEDELENGLLRPSFKQEILSAVEHVRREHPRVEIRIGSRELDKPSPPGSIPAWFWPRLPEGARIHICEQDPWETVHILSNGDVVPCEVQERLVLGSLRDQSLGEIWQGSEYRRFRRSFCSGANPACASCPWKMVHAACVLPSRIEPLERASAAFLRGWYPRDAAGSLWSETDAVLVLGRTPGSRGLRLQGALPPAAGGGALNALGVYVGGVLLVEVLNPGRELLEFSAFVPQPDRESDPTVLRFTTRTGWCPATVSNSGDTRRLGFALYRIGPVP